MYCKNCGCFVDDNLVYCMSCGAQVKEKVKPDSDDKNSFGFALLGFFIPIVGLILYIIYHKNMPGRAKSVGIGAIVGFVCSVIFSIIITVFSTLFSFALFNNIFEAVESAQNVGNYTISTESSYASQAVPNVSLGEFTTEYNGYQLETWVDVTVTNPTDERHSFWIEISAISPNGTQLKNDTLYVENLNPKQSALLKGFTNLTDYEITLLENAEFKVVKTYTS